MGEFQRAGGAVDPVPAGALDDFAEGLVLLSPEGRVLAWNSGAADVFGYSSAEAVGRAFDDLAAAPGAADHERQRARARAEGVATYECLSLRRDGASVRIEASLRAVRAVDGTVERLALAARDVTVVRCQGQSRLLASRFGALLEAVPDGFLVVGRDGRVLLSNAEARHLLGYPAEALVGLPVGNLMPERFRAAHTAHRERYFADPRSRPMGADLELFGLRRDGTEFPAEISLSPFESDDLQLVAVAVRDVTQRRRADARFRELLEAAPDAMVIVDAQGQILLVNSAAEQLFGYRRSELLGQPVEALVPLSSRPGHAGHRAAFARQPARRPMGSGLDLRARRRDGSEFPAEISLAPLHTDEGVLVSAAVRDVSERLRLEELRRAAARLEQEHRQTQEASRLKSAFLANMSHELRTPLNSIVGFAELIHDGKVGPVTAEQKEYLQDVLASARHLVQLLGDLLDLSKVEAGKLEVHPEPLRLDQLAAEVRDGLRQQAALKGLAVEVEVAHEVREVVADPGRLRQVLWNLLSNAVKFTPEGGHVAVRAHAEGPLAFRLEVQDDGPGIPPEQLSRLFTEFQQLDTGPAKRHQGTGLGLALTRRLVEAQGGRVGVESAPGRGSLFFAVLPRRGVA